MQFAALDDLSSAPAAPPPPALTRKRKAALIVQLLISDGGKLSLSSMPEKLQEILAHELGSIRLVDRDTVESVAKEFADLLSAVGLSAPGGPAAAVEALAPHLSPDLAVRLREQMMQIDVRDPWPFLVDLPVERLAVILDTESAEVGAVLLSKLPVEAAATALGSIPGEQARRITFAVSRTAQIAPAVVTRIGKALMAEYCQQQASAFDDPPADRVGTILNSTAADLREGVLTGLETDDQGFAKDVRRKIFTFVDIPDRLAPENVPVCLRLVAAETFSTAMAYALAADLELQNAGEYVLSNISQRLATQIREEAEEMGKIARKEGEAAMLAVTNAIRAEADKGALKLIDPHADAEED